MEPKKYDRSLPVEFGGEVIEIGPLRGLKSYVEFENALREEVEAFRARLDSGVYDTGALPSDPSHLFTTAVDVPRLLRLAAPQITDAMLDNSTPAERLGVLVDCTRLNKLGHLVIFFEPATLLDIGLRLSQMSQEIFKTEFGSQDFNTISSEPELTGTVSNTI